MKPLTGTDDARILQHCLHDGPKACTVNLWVLRQSETLSPT
jgi:hypothetical protein